MKERIEQLEQELAELKKQLEDHGFSEGDWLISDKECHLVRFLKYTAETTFTSSEIIGSCTCHTGWDAKTFRKATPEEIESALIEEAKRRGFPCDSWKFNSVVFYGHIDENWQYVKQSDTLTSFEGIVYRQGKWGQVIEEKANFFEWDVEYVDTGHHCLIIEIGCETYPKTFLWDLKKALNHVSDHSVQEVIDELEKLDL